MPTDVLTLKFDTWAPDLQNVALEAGAVAGPVPCADCLNVYFQDAAFRCLPGPNAFGPALGEQALSLFSGYDNISGNNYIYAGGANDIQLFQNGVWTPVAVEPTVTVTLTGVQILFSQGGSTLGASVNISGVKVGFSLGNMRATGGILYNGTIEPGGFPEYPNVGYIYGTLGALSPLTTYAGITINSLTTYTSNNKPFTQLTLAALVAQNYLTTVSIPTLNKSFQTANATSFVQTGNAGHGTTQWIWPGSFGFTPWQAYQLLLIA